MQKRLIFFSSQISDDENFQILISFLRKKYNITFIDSKKYAKLVKLNIYKKDKKKYIYKQYKKNILSSNLVITGSAKHTFEKNIWHISKKLKKKTLCIVDSWVNLLLRFNKKNFPKYIIFPNNNLNKNIINFFKKRCKIYFLGQPYLEKVSKINFKSSKKNILFLSSRQNYASDLFMIDKICNKYPKHNIYIKIHSKDFQRKWIKKLNRQKHSNLKISKKSLIYLIKRSNYVFGIYTMGLLVSIIAKKKTFINFDLSKKSEYLYSLLKKYGFDITKKLPPEEKLDKFRVKRFVDDDIYINSTKKIINLIDDISDSN